MNMKKKTILIPLFCALVICCIAVAASLAMMKNRPASGGSGEIVPANTVSTRNENIDAIKSQSDYQFMSPDFFSCLEDKKCFLIPGLESTTVDSIECTTMCPQGMTRYKDYFLVSAYDTDKQVNSVIYIVDNRGRYVNTVVLNGKYHVGGIAYDGSRIWYCANDKDYAVGYFTVETLEEIISGKKVILEENVNCFLREIESIASCMTCYDDRLWICEYNDNKPGQLVAYDIASDGKLSKSAEYIVPKKSQGLVFHDNKLFISTSYGRRSTSVMYIYDFIDNKMGEEPLKMVEFPSMMEEIEIKGGNLYAVFESGAYKYRDGRSITDWVLAVNIKKLLKSEFAYQ